MSSLKLKLVDYFTPLLLSVLLFLMVIPVYCFINVIDNRFYVAVYSLVSFFFIVALVLHSQHIEYTNVIVISVVLLLIYMIVFQFPLIGFFFDDIEADALAVKNVLAFKDLIAGGLVTFFMMLYFLNHLVSNTTIFPMSSPDKWILRFFVLIVLSTCFSPSAVEIKFTYFIHSLGSFCLFYFFFRTVNIGQKDLKAFAMIIIVLCIFLFIVGLLIYNHYEVVWRDVLKVKVPYAAMGGRSDLQWPPPWFNTSLEFKGHLYVVKRMVSLVGNPVTLGYIFVFSFCVSLWLNKKILSMILVAAIAFTLSKGALLCMGIVLFFYVMPLKKVRDIIFYDLAILAVTMFAALVLMSKTAGWRLGIFILPILSHIRHPGIHSLIGYGLGSGGTMASEGGFIEGNADATGAESALGTIIFSLGFLGGIIWIAIFVAFQIEFMKRYSMDPNKLYKVCIGISTGLLLCSVFQENIINMNVYIPYLLMLATCLNKKVGDVPVSPLAA